jgi:DNA polymerase-3 subunit delta'
MSFDEVLGHETIRQCMSRVFGRDRISHAYLLAGPEGIGKSLLAQQLAKTLLCNRSPVGSGAQQPMNPCGECGSCQALASGNHGALQILASVESRGIEVGTLREMMRSLSLRSGDRRVVVIDPAERLAEPAANALLKILEEPPAGVVFLLISHRPAQLLSTIISRCQRVTMGPLTLEPFLEVLATVPIDESSGRWLFEAVGGRPGAAIRLQQALERCGGEEALAQLLHSPVRDPRDLVAVAGDAGGQTDREVALATIRVLTDAIWAFRPAVGPGRWQAAEKATLLSHVARHVERSGSVDLCLEATALVLSATDLEQLRIRLPRSLGVA